jgi:hypothetical protein
VKSFQKSPTTDFRSLGIKISFLVCGSDAVRTRSANLTASEPGTGPRVQVQQISNFEPEPRVWFSEFPNLEPEPQSGSRSDRFPDRTFRPLVASSAVHAGPRGSLMLTSRPHINNEYVISNLETRDTGSRGCPSAIFR